MNTTIKWGLLAMLAVMEVASAQGTETGGSGTTTTSEQDALRVMSFNIRYNNPDDGVNAWPNRRDRVADLITFYQPDTVGIQEALPGQITDLEARLPDYAWFGVGRDGDNEGEYSAIFYRPDRLELSQNDTFWLSETPERVASVGWDAALPRIVTWGAFRDTRTGATFYHVNTHFDHEGETARTNSARLITDQIKQLAGSDPVVVTGDFNFEPEAEGYRVLTSNLQDAYSLPEGGSYGPEGTFSGFEVTPELGGRIDYVFVTDGVQVLRHGVLTDSEGGFYPSDHLPVLADVMLN